MSKRVYIGVDGVARRAKKMYIGIGDIARKVKKGYIGVGGVARPFLSGDLEYYGVITPLSSARQYMASSANSAAVVFGGGSGSGFATTVDAYDRSLVHSTLTPLSVPRDIAGGATVNNNILIAGGRVNGSAMSAYVESYDASLTRSTQASLSIGRYSMGSVSFAGYAMFGGGNSNGTTTGARANVDVYDSTLTRSSASGIGARYGLTTSKTPSHALFCGGYNGSSSVSWVYAFDALLTQSNPTSLSLAAQNMVGAYIGEYALIPLSNGMIDVYSDTLTRSTISGGAYSSAASLPDYAIITQGIGNATIAFDKILTKITLPPLSVARALATGGTIGDYALFAGGSSTIAAVDVYSA